MECSYTLIQKKKNNQLLLQQAVLSHLKALGETIVSPQNENAYDNKTSTFTANLVLPLNQQNHTVDYDVVLKTHLLKMMLHPTMQILSLKL
eukprot:15355702-Ditylum_brightwellii.AAC.1